MRDILEMPGRRLPHLVLHIKPWSHVGHMVSLMQYAIFLIPALRPA